MLDEKRVYDDMGEDIASERFMIVSKPHEKRREGFPLDSLSVHIASGRYYYDLEGYDEKYSNNGFAAFFEKALF